MGPFKGIAANSRLALVVSVVVATTAMAALCGAAGAASGGIGSSSGVEEAPAAGPGKYDRIWWRLSARERRWANRTAACESGRNPRAIGGGGRYRGAFQFMKSTWRVSPRSPGGDPIAYSYRTQAVVAVLLKRRDGAGHWPVCG